MKTSPGNRRPRKASSRLTVEQIDQILREYQAESITGADLARRHDLVQGTVNRLIRDAGIPRRPYHQGYAHPNASIKPSGVEELRRLHAEGMHLPALKARFGLSRHAIFSILHGRTWGPNPYPILPLPPPSTSGHALSSKRSRLRKKGLLGPRITPNAGLTPKQIAAKRRRYAREWYYAHPERAGLSAQRRRARMSGARVIEEIDRIAIWLRDGGRCYLCGRKVSRLRFDLDHMLPLSKGGEHAAFNLAATHPRCNGKKYNRLIPVQLPIALKA